MTERADLRAELAGVLSERSRRSAYAPGRDDYMLYAVDRVSDDGSEIWLTVTFREAESYCCMELVCHFSPGAADFAALRRTLERHGLHPTRITLRPRWRVEAGARIGLRFPGDKASPLTTLGACEGDSEPWLEPGGPCRGEGGPGQ